MATLTLESAHYEDIEDLLAAVEGDFQMKFSDGDFANIRSVGQLCDTIADKVPLIDSETCTSQQAFYKIRAAFRTMGHLDQIIPDTSLESLLPRKDRIAKVRELERELEMSVGILSPPDLISNTIWIGALISTAGLFYDWRIFLPCLFFVILVGTIAYRFGKELDLETVSDLARNLAIDHYLAVRRDPSTINKKEFSQVLLDRLNLNYDEHGKLERETRIG
ncbi:hypothetical protein [Dyadobacter sp. 32]|uniref:hypothetical protein n=1 Tax=Dyadobacter sp. 32 TaxID=538966 RepID=UPI0011EDF57D